MEKIILVKRETIYESLVKDAITFTWMIVLVYFTYATQQAVWSYIISTLISIYIIAKGNEYARMRVKRFNSYEELYDSIGKMLERKYEQQSSSNIR